MAGISHRALKALRKCHNPLGVSAVGEATGMSRLHLPSQLGAVGYMEEGLDLRLGLSFSGEVTLSYICRMSRGWSAEEGWAKHSEWGSSMRVRCKTMWWA